jgi:hypothetical protein
MAEKETKPTAMAARFAEMKGHLNRSAIIVASAAYHCSQGEELPADDDCHATPCDDDAAADDG